MHLWLAVALLGASANPRTLYNDGVRAMQSGQNPQAIELFTQATQITPDWSLPWLELGISLLALEGDAADRTTQAITALQKATELNAENPRGYYYLGVAYRRQNNFEQAAAALKQCTTLRPRWLDALMAYGESLDHLGDAPTAITVYTQVRTLEPAQLGALRRLADLYESQKDTAQAEACWLELVRANPGVAYFHYQLGEFYQRMEMKKKAKAAFEDAAALDPRPNKKMRKLR